MEQEELVREDEVLVEEDGRELFNQVYNKRKTPYDGIKKLWAEVLLQAVGYANGDITNDHDCGGKPEVHKHFVKSSVRFLCGSGNLKLACNAAGVDINSVKQFGNKHRYLLQT